jgi:hypothetical protein
MKLQAICISLFLLLLISGCAVGQAGQSSTTEPTMLRIVRVNTNPYMTQYPPLKETIRDAAVVQHIYQEAYTLPQAPRETCLLGTGSLIYQLYFFRGKTLLKEMNFGVIGCQFLQLSKTDIRDSNSQFDLLLRQTLHLNSLVSQS